ncbi:MAG: thiamine-phosphate kinase, partial [Gammaproteobacteria bacterium]
MPISEFSIIERFAQRVSNPRPDVRLGIGDDGAVVTVPAGMELVVSMDTIVEGVHFLPGTEPRLLGYKALAVNLSDLAAMGAEPAWATMALTLPESDTQWIEEFADGFFSLADRYSVALIGGDITQGPLTVTVQVHGFVPMGAALQRAGAKVEDHIAVTGTLGDAGMGLQMAKNQVSPVSDDNRYVINRWQCPEPRIGTGVALRGIASSCIDVSDGLLGDLGHVLNISGVGASIIVDKIPLSDAFKRLSERPHTHDKEDLYRLPLTAGDDYELCFTVPDAARARLAKALDLVGVQYTIIGRIRQGSGVSCVRNNGEA